MAANSHQDWVLIAGCGCCVGVCTKRVAPTEDEAWLEFCPTREDERAAHQRNRGLTLKLISHHEWSATYADSMIAGCSHQPAEMAEATS